MYEACIATMHTYMNEQILFILLYFIHFLSGIPVN